MFLDSIVNVICLFLLTLEYFVFVRFEPVKSADPPKNLSVLVEKNSRLFCEDFLVASLLFFLLYFSKNKLENQ